MTASRENLQWCQNLFASLADDGVWGVPRSGLVFKKQGKALVLIEQMPFIEGMPLSPPELVKYQDGDFTCIQRTFAEAGIPVIRKENT